jgi:Predicted membrane protein
LGTTIEAFIVAALPEEGFKLLALWLVLRKNPFFDEHFDGIVYAVCIGLGFATIENVGFIFQEGNGLSVAISRALFAVPGHYAFAVIMGYYYSLYHFVDRSPRTAIYILLIPVVAHGIYDAIVLGGNVNPYIGCVSTFVLICFCIKMHKFAKEKMFAQIDRDKKCYNT